MPPDAMDALLHKMDNFEMLRDMLGEASDPVTQDIDAEAFADPGVGLCTDGGSSGSCESPPLPPPLGFGFVFLGTLRVPSKKTFRIALRLVPFRHSLCPKR